MSEALAFIRPAAESDLPHFLSFAQEAGPGITSLPRNPALLEQLLAQSVQTFSSPSSEKGERFLFCLEWQGRVVGVSGVVARIGVEEPFFAFHKQIETHSSSLLKREISTPILTFIEARKKPTEIGTLYLKKECRGKGLSPLLSYSRFLFIKLFRERFAQTVIVELRGVNEEGLSPFWEGVGRHFFGIDFSDADHLRFSHPEVIQELFPRYPIYAALLPQEAQAVIQQPHQRTVPAKKILEKQGFQLSEYLDIFDAGPHYFAPTNSIHAVRETRRATVSELRNTLESEERAIISNTRIDYRACLSPILVEDSRATLSLEAGRALKIEIGEEILYYGLS